MWEAKQPQGHLLPVGNDEGCRGAGDQCLRTQVWAWGPGNLEYWEDPQILCSAASGQKGREGP